MNYLWRILREYYHRGRSDLLAAYSQLALDRVWKGERFSWFMTRLLHDFPDQNAFDAKMQAADRRYYLLARRADHHRGKLRGLAHGACRLN